MPSSLNTNAMVEAPGREDVELHRIHFAEDVDDPLRGSLTLAILLVFLGSGISGILRHNPSLITLKRPVQAKVDIVQVDLTKPPPPPPDQLPPPPELTLPENTPVIAVAAPTAPVAFALPVDGLVQIVEPRYATATAPVAQTTNVTVVQSALPSPQRISSPGTGNNPLPLPNYPASALRKHQTGTVTMQVALDTDGKVTAIKLLKGTRYTELNEGIDHEATSRWLGKAYFPPGPQRILEFEIEFNLR